MQCVILHIKQVNQCSVLAFKHQQGLAKISFRVARFIVFVANNLIIKTDNFFLFFRFLFLFNDS